VRLLESNLFETVESGYRVILSNPPYVPDARLKELPPEYGHEPQFAFSGGPTGLSLVSRILVESAQYLTADGILVVEVGEAHEAFAAEYPGLPVTWLEFDHGGEGVFVLTRDELTGYLTG
jgi:ribosomal protein L3 glutamine methyltransferase